MDCEKFAHHVMDALYDELDELTYAAMKRHMESCSRCTGVFDGLRTTREMASLPLEKPSDGLEARILDAVAEAQHRTPWHRKALRALAWAGSHAMRPQLAMAALFVLVVGSSLLLLRAKPGTVGVSPVRVTERGAPVPEEEPAAAPTEAPAPTQAAAAAAAPAAEAEMADGKRRDDGGKKEDSADSKSDAMAALSDARVARDKSGCQTAVELYDKVGQRFAGTVQATDAMWEAAACYRSMGNAQKAKELYQALRSTDTYGDRAEREMAGLDAPTNQNSLASRAKAVTAAKPAGGASKAGAPGGGPGQSIRAAPAPAPKKAADKVDAAAF